MKDLHKNNRRIGKTTRMADNFIQSLFENGIIQVFDHSLVDNEHKRLFGIIEDRLKREHAHLIDNITFDKKKIDNKDW